jgi:hypothetical protein
LDHFLGIKDSGLTKLQVFSDLCPMSFNRASLPLEQAKLLAEQRYGAGRIHIVDSALVLAIDPAQAPEIARMLVSAGLALSELRQSSRFLEATFMELTEEEHGTAETGGKTR